MKTLISILFVMMIIGCATTPTMESVAGTYEMEDGEETIKYVLLENGKGRSYLNGEIGLGRLLKKKFMAFLKKSTKEQFSKLKPPEI